MSAARLFRAHWARTTCNLLTVRREFLSASWVSHQVAGVCKFHGIEIGVTTVDIERPRYQDDHLSIVFFFGFLHWLHSSSNGARALMRCGLEWNVFNRMFRLHFFHFQMKQMVANVDFYHFLRRLSILAKVAKLQKRATISELNCFFGGHFAVLNVNLYVFWDCLSLASKKVVESMLASQIKKFEGTFTETIGLTSVKLCASSIVRKHVSNFFM